MFWLFLLFILAIIGGYAAGFRPGPGLTIVRVGTLTLAHLPSGTSVYTDQAFRGTTKEAGPFSVSLVPGNHSVIVDAPKQEPWTKTFTITTSETTTLSPIFVPKEADPRKVSAEELPTATSVFARTALPTTYAPLVLDCANVYVLDNRLIAEASTASDCTPPDFLCIQGSCEATIIYAPAAPLRSVIPFPGRTDAVLVSVADWIYALALDPRTPQYFAPVLHGVAPTLATASSTAFYVRDAGRVYSISFEY